MHLIFYFYFGELYQDSTVGKQELHQDSTMHLIFYFYFGEIYILFLFYFGKQVGKQELVPIKIVH